MELVQLQLAAVVVVACSQYNNFKGDAWFRSLNIYICIYISMWLRILFLVQSI